MRLLPAVPTAVTRVSPPEGMEVEGTFIPGNVKIVAPRYPIGRRESYPSGHEILVKWIVNFCSGYTADPLFYFIVESAWEEPYRFCPDRWHCRPGMIRDRRAFAPFGLGKLSCPFDRCYSLTTREGKTSCVGKNLALTEIRMVIASLLSTFHLSFPPGDDGKAVEGELRDQLTAKPGQLNLIFRLRDIGKS